MFFQQKTKFISKIRLIAIALLAITISAFAHEEGRCGFMQLMESIQQSSKEPAFAKTAFQETHKKCRNGALYDSVHIKKTKHFQIMYVLEGPHKTKEVFVDTVAKVLEEAWDTYVNKFKMREPLGSSTSLFYKKSIEQGLYPIEIVDLTQAAACARCYGQTKPINRERPEETQISIENDFLLPPNEETTDLDTMFLDNDTCIYKRATQAQYNIIHDYSYVDEWVKAIRLTIFHELYHAVQLRYLSLYKNATLWFEASASGMEEVTLPQIDDYQRYLTGYFYSIATGISIKKVFSTEMSYGNGLVFLYLYNHLSHGFDKEIWESFSQNPDKPFEYQLNNIASKRNLSADSLFHDYSIRLAFSGKKRSATVDSSFWITSDQSNWPAIPFRQNKDELLELQKLASIFHRDTINPGRMPNLQNFIGKASVILFNDNHPNIKYLLNNKTIDSLQADIQSSDSVIWVFSRFTEESDFPIFARNLTLRAYPTPWRSGSLCFTPLSLDEKFIEIRNRRGDLVLREKYEQATHCMDEELVRKKLKPGLYRFRAGSKGKLKDLLIVY